MDLQREWRIQDGGRLQCVVYVLRRNDVINVANDNRSVGRHQNFCQTSVLIKLQGEGLYHPLPPPPAELLFPSPQSRKVRKSPI